MLPPALRLACVVLALLPACLHAPSPPGEALALRIPPAALAPLPARLAAPPAIVCRVDGTIAHAFRDENGVALRPSRDGAVFANMTFVRGEHVELTLLDGEDDARLDAEVDHVSFAFWTKREAFFYQPKTPFAVGGYVLPYSTPTEQWRYGGNGRFHSELALPEGLRPASGETSLHATRTCEQMKVAATWDRDDSLFAVAPAARIDLDSYETTNVAAGTSVPLSLDPGGASVAFLEPAEAIALQVRAAPNGAPPSADFAYVAWDTGHALVFGWAPRARLAPISGGGASFRSMSVCSGGVRAYFGARRLHRCETDVQLFARTAADAEPALVGTLHREALFQTSREGDDGIYTAIEPEMTGFSRSAHDDGASFLVRDPELASCPETTRVP